MKLTMLVSDRLETLKTCFLIRWLISAPARISKGQGAGAKRAQCQNKKGNLPWNRISVYPLSHMIFTHSTITLINWFDWAIKHILPFFYPF